MYYQPAAEKVGVDAKQWHRMFGIYRTKTGIVDNRQGHQEIMSSAGGGRRRREGGNV